MKRSYIYCAILLTLFLLGINGFAQDKSEKEYKHEFCSDNNWSNGDKVSANVLREMNVPAASILKVDSKNGRITVTGENRNDVLVRACVRTWAKSETEANSVANAVRIETSPTIRAVNTPDENWSVSYEIRVPRATNLDLSSNNGRITITSVTGQMKFQTDNGRITLEDVAGDIKGRTNNGRVTVSLAGNYWQGNGLDVETGNGRITLYMPSNFAANVEIGTTNGRFSSDFAELQAAMENEKEKRRSGPKRVSASINGGGSPIRLITTNGRVSIHSSSKDLP